MISRLRCVPRLEQPQRLLLCSSTCCRAPHAEAIGATFKSPVCCVVCCNSRGATKFQKTKIINNINNLVAPRRAAMPAYTSLITY
jgi:hypothetical protein